MDGVYREPVYTVESFVSRRRVGGSSESAAARVKAAMLRALEKAIYARERQSMWFLGMDVGTGGTRAVVVDADGKLISGASSEHAPFRTPHPGWAEQDPEDWWRAAQEAIRCASGRRSRADSSRLRRSA